MYLEDFVKNVINLNMNDSWKGTQGICFSNRCASASASATFVRVRVRVRMRLRVRLVIIIIIIIIIIMWIRSHFDSRSGSRRL